MLTFLFVSGCKNKELDYEDNCGPNPREIKVVVHWDDHETQSRIMRINLFSNTDGVPHYGRDDVPKVGEKIIKLSEGASYIPFCYDYYAANIYFRYESDHNQFEAFCRPETRTVIEKYGNRASGEQTVSQPREFYVDVPDEYFSVVFPMNNTEPLVFHFYPKNILREFTYCIKNVKGINNIKDTQGTISGMASSYLLKSKKLGNERSTLIFDDCEVGGDNDDGYIRGRFYTFGPVEPYQNLFGIFIWSSAERVYPKEWDVSFQITESMTDRPAKLARDGYDILIEEEDIEITEETKPPGENGSGFEVGVDEWNEVEIYL